MNGIRVVLTDIEGTTSPIAFVRDVLFPLARHRMAGFVAGHGGEPEVAALLADARHEGGLAEDASEIEVVRLLRRWIDEDRKATPLKALQGMIWASAWASGEVVSPVYEDAVRGLQRWFADGKTLAVYSSGSIAAQQRYFRFSTAGDLTPLFSGWFDTTTGPKREVGSYEAIVQALDVPAQAIHFLSDVPEELDAAAAAGMHTTWLIRPEDLGDVGTIGQGSRHPVAATFDGVRLGGGA